MLDLFRTTSKSNQTCEVSLISSRYLILLLKLDLFLNYCHNCRLTLSRFSPNLIESPAPNIGFVLLCEELEILPRDRLIHESGKHLTAAGRQIQFNIIPVLPVCIRSPNRLGQVLCELTVTESFRRNPVVLYNRIIQDRVKGLTWLLPISFGLNLADTKENFIYSRLIGIQKRWCPGLPHLIFL